MSHGRVSLNILALVVAMIAAPAFGDADDSSSQTKANIQDVNGSFNKTPGEDVDDTLTNNKLRAETGSKSRFSIATVFDYDGGSLNKPLAADRPNIQAVTGDTAYTDLNGQISAKYNFTQKDSLLVGGGLRWVTPLQTGTRPSGYDGQMFDVFNPSVSYQHVYKIGNVQSYYQVGPTFFTETNLVGEGYIGNIGIYNVNAYELGTSRFTLGLESNVQTGYYKPIAPYGSMTPDQVRADESDYSFFLYPYLEYKLTDKLNIRAVTFLISFEHTRLNNLTTWHQDRVIQSAGLGYAVTRDIFLYPNIQFVPDELRTADTNVGIEADINVF